MTVPALILAGLALRDDDAAPLALAQQLARLIRSPLALVNACPREMPPPLPAPPYAVALRDQAQQELETVADALPDECAATAHVQFGSPAGVIGELADAHGAAAVVVGSTHRGTLGRVLIGDVAAGLLHGSSCAVAVAPRGYDPNGSTDLRRIGVAFDGTPESCEALAAAIGLARRTGASLDSYTVLEPIAWSPMYARPGWVPSPADEEARLQRAQSTAEEALEAVPRGVLATAEVVHGRAVPALAELSQDLDLLVCGSRGYGALRGVMAGSVSRGLAHSAACPLLVVPRRASASGADLWRPAGPDEVT